MKKRILSMTLALSIVASLFAGLSFSASATEYTDYTAAGANGKANITDTGKDATKSLIGDKLPIGTYYYNTYSSENGIAIAEEPTAFLSNIDPVGDKDRYIGNLTSETNLTSSATIFDSETYMKYMWAKYEGGLVSELINDETKRWAQLNYELDGEATINTFIFGALSTSSTFASQYWQMPGHYKVIFSNTEEGLFDHSKATAVIDVDETKNTAFKTNRHTVTLNTPITAKYVGFRMICGFNNGSIGVAKERDIYMDRFMHFSVFGEYTSPAALPEGEATATAKDAESNTIDGIAVSAEIATVGNNDDANNYASAGVKLNAAENAKLGSTYYVFKGWYLGDTLVADKAVANYTFTGAEENMNFVAKYESTYEPYTDYTAAGKSNVGNLDDIGKNPERSLILNKAPYEGYVYNTIVNDKNIAVTEEPTKFELNEGVTYLTDTDFRSMGTTFKSVDYTKFMWANYGGDGKVSELINDESKRWSQINYELDAQATINTFVYGLTYDNIGGQYWQMPGHYKVIFSDTKEGLFNLEQANAVIEVDETKNATFQTNRHTITLNTPVTAKYVGLRMICGFNNGSVGVAKQSDMYMDRVSHLSVFGEYTSPAALPEGEATATAKDAEGNTIDGIAVSAEIATVGNLDESGDYASAGAKLNAAENAEVGDKYYVFQGWYLGETLVSDKAVADYAFTGAEENMNFVAKYVKTYKPYTDYTAAGKSNVGDLNDIGKDPSKSLILNKAPYEGYVYNTIVNDKNIVVTEEPTKFELNKDVTLLTDNDFSSLGTTFKSVDYTKFMWANYGDNGKVSELINDESKRWSQINYELDAQATINTFVYGVLLPNAGGQYWQMPGHYKVIFSDTKEGLFDLEKANAVIEVDETKDATFKTNRHTITLNTPVTAKYVGLRMICGLNNGSVNVAAASNMYMDRVSHFSVFGTYTASTEAEVNVVTEEGVPSSLVSKSDAVYTGNVDDNGNYAAGSVTVTATESYEDKANLKLYTFKGWYNGEELVSANAEYTYDLTKGDITLTAKYDVDETTVKYTLTFVDAAQKVLGTVDVEEGKTVDMALVNAIVVKDIYGYEVFRDEDGNVVWDKGFDEAITADATYTALYKAKDINTAVTIYKLDNKTEYEKQGTQKYDTAITLSCEGAKSWVDENGNVLLDTAEGVLYACGSSMKLYPVSEQKTAPEVAVVGKVNDGNYSVFAHVNVENATAYGVVFSSSTGFDQKNDFTVEDVIADTTGKRYKMVEIDATKVGQVDFMATLTGTGDKTRYARAYVVVGGQYYYTNAVCNK